MESNRTVQPMTKYKKKNPSTNRNTNSIKINAAFKLPDSQHTIRMNSKMCRESRIQIEAKYAIYLSIGLDAVSYRIRIAMVWLRFIVYTSKYLEVVIWQIRRDGIKTQTLTLVY